MFGQSFDTMIVASSDREWLYNDLSKYKCWKLFIATLNAAFNLIQHGTREEVALCKFTHVLRRRQFKV